MISSLSPDPQQDNKEWVQETKFGKWFLTTNMWYKHVLAETITNLGILLADDCPRNGKLLEVGCGQGKSFKLLEQTFQPKEIYAVDIDKDLLKEAQIAKQECECNIKIYHGSAKKLNLPDDSFDIIFCHQLLHHITFQEQALQEFKRLLKPGGKLLVSESCQKFLDIWWVRIFFRHPKMQQKTAEEYKDLIIENGFFLKESDTLETTPWWSKNDLGIFAKYGLQFWTTPTSEIALVASKPT